MIPLERGGRGVGYQTVNIHPETPVSSVVPDTAEKINFQVRKIGASRLTTPEAELKIESPSLPEAAAVLRANSL